MIAFVSLTNYLLPVVGLFWGVLLLGETITTWTVVALVVILAGIFVSSSGPRGRIAPRLAE